MLYVTQNNKNEGQERKDKTHKNKMTHLPCKTVSNSCAVVGSSSDKTVIPENLSFLP